ncbi:MAG: hypothetical protein P8Y47_06440, partial [Alphaproteobacteria bacterium]
MKLSADSKMHTKINRLLVWRVFLRGMTCSQPPISAFRIGKLFSSLMCLVLFAASLAVPLTAHAGKGGVHGSNHSGGNGHGGGNGGGHGGGNGGGHGVGNGGGNGVGNRGNKAGGGGGLGNAYGHGNMGDLGSTGLSNQSRDISGTEALREAAQPNPNSFEASKFDEKWKAATDIEIEVDASTLKNLGDITKNAVDYLGSIAVSSETERDDSSVEVKSNSASAKANPSSATAKANSSDASDKANSSDASDKVNPSSATDKANSSDASYKVNSSSVSDKANSSDASDKVNPSSASVKANAASASAKSKTLISTTNSSETI